MPDEFSLHIYTNFYKPGPLKKKITYFSKDLKDGSFAKKKNLYRPYEPFEKERSFDSSGFCAEGNLNFRVSALAFPGQSETELYDSVQDPRTSAAYIEDVVVEIYRERKLCDSMPRSSQNSVAYIAETEVNEWTATEPLTHNEREV